MQKAEVELVKLLFGFGFFELGGKYALNMEQNGLGTSPFYLIMISLSAFGVVLFMNGSIRLYRFMTVKENLNTFTKQHAVKMIWMEVKKEMPTTAKGIIGIAIGFVLMAVLAPIGLDQIYAANTTLWETAVTTIFTLVLPIVFIIGGAMMFVDEIRS